VQEKLLTPLRLCSLAPGESSYAPHDEGGVWQRDGTYHQGTVWPWLIGLFVDQIAIPTAREAVDDDGKLKDERKAKQVASLAKGFVETAGKLWS
jgi:hypothetical protein